MITELRIWLQPEINPGCWRVDVDIIHWRVTLELLSQDPDYEWRPGTAYRDATGPMHETHELERV